MNPCTYQLLARSRRPPDPLVEEARAALEALAKRYEDQIESLTGDDFWFPNEECRERQRLLWAGSEHIA